jgi:hypothetical protein
MSHLRAVQHGHINVQHDAIRKRSCVQRLQPLLAVISGLDPMSRSVPPNRQAIRPALARFAPS